MSSLLKDNAWSHEPTREFPWPAAISGLITPAPSFAMTQPRTRLPPPEEEPPAVLEANILAGPKVKSKQSLSSL